MNDSCKPDEFSDLKVGDIVWSCADLPDSLDEVSGKTPADLCYSRIAISARNPRHHSSRIVLVDMQDASMHSEDAVCASSESCHDPVFRTPEEALANRAAFLPMSSSRESGRSQHDHTMSPTFRL